MLRLLAVFIALILAGCVASASAPCVAQDLSLPRVPWEGGPAYYGRFAAAKAMGWVNPSFFPVGVWYESVRDGKDVALDKGAGLNTYVELTDDSDLNLIRSNGMSALVGKPHPGMGAETVGWLIADEADMWAGPGDGHWSGDYPGEGAPCVPEKPPCGYTAMRTLKDRLPKGGDRMYYANYGKGVQFWQAPAEAGKFVNPYTDATSADMYWYTDPGICQEAGLFFKWAAAECPLAADYGAVVDRMRMLDAMDGRRQPLYAFVELGWPSKEGTRTIDAPQMAGAVMSSLIHEARGIVYFNHSFGGPCPSYHLLREPCYAGMRAAVTEMNRRIRELAPVLNTQSYVHRFSPDLDTMLKCYGGSCYVFAMVRRAGPLGSHTLTLPPELASARRVEVLFENRTIPVTKGAFPDSFGAEYAYHVYRVTP
ncbi:hypothetical protein [Microbispora oryzae]|uniref:hypothetical protein n=1 Tax=Microbispora oryzae TaxID=2806554 RepID=UPI001E53234E|nr:hypothetical protein [Microbispora oryzae]